jgi:UDP-N-acetylglucosamine--N-acetylmuramyl-(pentapeptide) pyrophosphoryl-undecaprenol N-acetylglucosamine transferase
VRDAIIDAATLDKADARRRHFGLDPLLPTLLVMGGSQGAHALNVTMMRAAGAFAGRIQVIHLAGEADSDAVFHAYGAAGLRSHVSSFFDAMEFAYGASDLALSRAGALSIAELAAAGVPAILVPLPHAKDDHQRANARAAERLGGCIMIDQTEFDAARAVELIGGILADRPRLDAMRRCALESVRGDAAESIIRILSALADRRAPAAEPSDKIVACAE